MTINRQNSKQIKFLVYLIIGKSSKITNYITTKAKNLCVLLKIYEFISNAKINGAINFFSHSRYETFRIRNEFSVGAFLGKPTGNFNNFVSRIYCV